jgi:hypothetical protein
LVWNPCTSRTPLAARSGPGAARRRSSTSRVVATSTAPIRWTRPSCSPTGLHRPRLHATGAARRPRDAEFVPVRVRPGRPGRRDNRDEPCPAVRRGVVRPAHAVGGGGTKQARVDARLCAREAPPAVAFREAASRSPGTARRSAAVGAVCPGGPSAIEYIETELIMTDPLWFSEELVPDDAAVRQAVESTTKGDRDAATLATKISGMLRCTRVRWKEVQPQQDWLTSHEGSRFVLTRPRIRVRHVRRGEEGRIALRVRALFGVPLRQRRHQGRADRLRHRSARDVRG